MRIQVEETRKRSMRLHLIWFIMVCFFWSCTDYRDMPRTVSFQFIWCLCVAVKKEPR